MQEISIYKNSKKVFQKIKCPKNPHLYSLCFGLLEMGMTRVDSPLLIPPPVDGPAEDPAEDPADGPPDGPGAC